MLPKMDSSVDSENTVTSAVARISAETKTAVDTMLEVASKNAELSKELLSASQELLNKNLALWRDCVLACTSLSLTATDAVSQIVAQSFSVRETAGQIVADAVKRSQSLAAQERQLLVDSAELVQCQAQTGVECAARAWSATSKVLSTTVQAGDGAAERFSKIATPVSASN